nr:hypothetical protein CFP56_33600 [Quercus suber]
MGERLIEYMLEFSRQPITYNHYLTEAVQALKHRRDREDAVVWCRRMLDARPQLFNHDVDLIVDTVLPRSKPDMDQLEAQNLASYATAYSTTRVDLPERSLVNIIAGRNTAIGFGFSAEVEKPETKSEDRLKWRVGSTSPVMKKKNLRYSIHACVHSWISPVLNVQHNAELAGAALRCVASHAPAKDPFDWSLFQRRSLNHANRCLDYLERETSDEPDPE